jgi:hypothetical protein
MTPYSHGLAQLNLAAGELASPSVTPPRVGIVQSVEFRRHQGSRRGAFSSATCSA